MFGYIEGPFGAHAEYLTIPEDASVATMPANATFEEAAASTEGSHYALAHIRAAKIRSGQDVLVYGATGAIGSAAVQLLKSLGAHVTAVCGTEHVALVERLGADRVIDYTAADFTKDDQTLRRRLRRGRQELVRPLQAIAEAKRDLPLDRPRTVPPEPDPGAHHAAVPAARRSCSRFRSTTRRWCEHIKGLIESGAFKPVIDRRYPLDEIVEAYRYVETGQKIGNVVISLAGRTE